MGFFYIAQLILRLLVIATTIAAAIILATSQQTISVFGIQIEARYSYAPSFRINLVADCVVCGLTAFSLVLLFILNRPKSNPNSYFYLLLNDLTSLVVLLSGLSAAMAIGYVGQFGMIQSGWMPICDRLPKFCDKIMASVASCFVAVLCCLVLTVMSAYKLFSSKSKFPHVDI